MNCQEFWDSMPELSGSHDDETARHLRDCPACSAGLERQRRMSQALRQVACDLASTEAPARVEQRLVSAFRGAAGIPPERQPAMWFPVLTWAAALAALITIALFLARDRQPEPARRVMPSRVQLAYLTDIPEPQAAEESPYEQGGYIRLPNAERIGPNDDVNLVRVVVPRSSMIALGYSVSADRAAEPVEAEVVLGFDGQARAVRFLDE